MNKIQFCPMCKKEDEKVGILYAQGFLLDEDELYEICPDCGCKELITYNISNEDVTTICDISKDPSFLESMIKLKESDPIDYALKMSQFKNYLGQQKIVNQQANESNNIVCPYCKSTNTKKITTTAKAINTAVFGILGTKRHKQWHCNNCNSDF